MNIKFLKDLIFGLAFCFPFWFGVHYAFSATYYVANAGNDSCDGTAQTISTSGACARETINKVNISSFNAGDSVLFNKGDTWREQLIVPSSGSSGSPITFGAYGTGADPVFSGADLVTTWTQSNGDEFSDNFDDNNLTGWSTSGGVAAVNQRVEVTIDNGDIDYFEISGYGTSRDEYWAFYRFQIGSAGLTWSPGDIFGLGGIAEQWNVQLALSVSNNSGNAMRYTYVDDSGTTSSVVGGVKVTADAYHDVVMHYKIASGVGADDGIAQIWVDGVEVLNLIDVDNDAVLSQFKGDSDDK